MKRLSWKYVAGIIDGEGCIDARTDKKPYGHYVSPRVRVTLAEPGKQLVYLLQNNYGGSVDHRPSKNEAWSDAYCWTLTGYKNSCMFLRNICNHLIIKREQARLLLWMEVNLKGKHISDEARKCVLIELRLQKADPHRLSERAQEQILKLL